MSRKYKSLRSETTKTTFPKFQPVRPNKDNINNKEKNINEPVENTIVEDGKK